MLRSIYLDEDEEITQVIDKIRNISAIDIELIFPKKSPLIRSIVNLKILKKESQALKKNIIISTKDEIGKNLAKKANLKIKTVSPEPLKKSKITPKEKEETQEINEKSVDPQENLIAKLKQQPTPEVNKPDYHKINQEAKQKKIEYLKQKFQARQKPKFVLLPTATSKLVISFFIVCFIVAIISIIFLLPQATILIIPKTEPFNHNLEISLRKDINEPNLEEKILPYEVSSVQKQSGEETFPASGEQEIGKKSKGQVIIYNKYSSDPQFLVSSTRFLSSENKIYRLIQDTEVPGAKIQEGKKVPGRISAVIEADQVGSDFDTEETHFTIPGLGAEKQDEIYAESLEPITGGESRKVQIITAEDLRKAKDSLNEKIIKQTAEELKEKVTEDKIILETATKNEIINITTNGEENKETKNFIMSLEVKTTVPIVSKQNLSDVIFKDAQSFLPNNKKMQDQDLNDEIKYERESDTPEEIKLKVSLDKKIFTEIDQEEIKKNITGLTAQETQDYLMTNPYIYKAEIMLWPFWVKKVPRIKGKIKIIEKSLEQAENEE